MSCPHIKKLDSRCFHMDTSSKAVENTLRYCQDRYDQCHVYHAIRKEDVMDLEISGYRPGMYRGMPTRTIKDLAEENVNKWIAERSKLVERRKEEVHSQPPTIVFSRKIGSGAIEVAQMLADMTGYFVLDRQVLEYIASDAKLTTKTVEAFDERGENRIHDYINSLFREKSFTISDYTRHLFSAIAAISRLGKAIIVGRGAHYVLERDKILSVYLTASDEYRIKRMVGLYDAVTAKEAKAKLKALDQEQKEFFARIFNVKTFDPTTYDLIICKDHVSTDAAAKILLAAFKEKFGSLVN